MAVLAFFPRSVTVCTCGEGQLSFYYRLKTKRTSFSDSLMYIKRLGMGGFSFDFCVDTLGKKSTDSESKLIYLLYFQQIKFHCSI